MNLTTWIRQIRDTIVNTEDSICLERAQLAAEGYLKWEHVPVVLKRAHTFAHILQNMTLDLDSNPLFAGNTSSRIRGWMLLPEYGFGTSPQIVHENPQLEGLIENGVPQEMRDFWKDRSKGWNAGIGHLAVNQKRVVAEGLNAFIAEAKAHLHEGTQTEQDTREAMIISLQAVIDWAHRYADAAELAAARAEDTMLREAHLRVARACRHVPAQPARDVFEALQAMLLVHLAIQIEGHGLSVSIGSPDRAMVHLLSDDLDPDWLTDIVSAFMLKINTNSLFGRGSKTQAITVGGVDHNGVDQCNALTLAFLNAADKIRVGDPHVFLRWHENIDSAIKKRAIELLGDGLSMPLLIHDTPTAQGFINAGVTPEHAWQFSVIGCNELGIPGLCADSATASSGTVQYLATLNEVLLNEDSAEFISMDALLSAMEKRLYTQLKKSRGHAINNATRIEQNLPTPFTSALMDGCIVRGKDMSVGMEYHLPGIYERGLSNGVNALAAIEYLVFETGQLTIQDLVNAIRSDFEGNETLRMQLRLAPKWGNGDDHADHWAQTLIDMRERVLTLINKEMPTGPHMVCHVVRSLHYFDGKRIAASPDGRHAWTPVSDSIGAEAGTVRKGPTGVLSSVARLNAAEYYRGGYNLNVTLPGAKWGQPEMQANLLAMTETFFAKGGQELQLNVLDAKTLRAAQTHPEHHGDIVVRIAGFNARFVDLARVEQDELIYRAEHA